MRPPVGEPRTVWMPEQDGPPSALDPSAVASALDRIRSSVHRWLDRIDGLAAAAVDAALASERRCASLQAELERREVEWASQLEAIEHDRRMLAEAWERLEREQIALMTSARPADVSPQATLPAMPAQASRQAAHLEESVDRAIIRQFEALRKDVRRAAESRGVTSP